ncbi:iron-sulfur cluster assembly accessory protein [Aliidiomarina shirensis]|uniref:Iron-sulfur cluster assembly accessory protein n=1 Tax=Aliidiomarina shirensis TaxID=1048642 RepID=A0A432WSV9_9GAMM|nr:iron-sulfur cluster assembly accessory protein [Aliidiomarina shirensis]RUO36862.1 iron-sulfur cluster assembly accessory protein [Aliidiomarina shirensis]
MSVESFVPESRVITVTPSATKHFEAKIAATPEKIIRLSTKPSGCTGYAYVVDLADVPEEGDEVVEVNEKLTLAVAKSAVPMLRNTELDYVKEGINGILKFNNPNVVDACGCGESFSVS